MHNPRGLVYTVSKSSSQSIAIPHTPGAIEANDTELGAYSQDLPRALAPSQERTAMSGRPTTCHVLLALA